MASAYNTDNLTNLGQLKQLAQRIKAELDLLDSRIDTLEESCGDDIIKIQDTQPTASATKIWMTETAPSSVQVPTVSELNAVEQSLNRAINVLEPSASAGDVGKVPKVKTVADGKVSEYEFGSLPSVPVTDVQVNGTSILSQGVADVPVMSGNTYGVAKLGSGLTLDNGAIKVNTAGNSEIQVGTTTNALLTPGRQHRSVFYGLAAAAGDTSQSSSSNTVGTYTENALSKISDMLNAPVSVSGSTPSITAKAGIRYVCGGCSTLTVVLPASGCVDVVFESGSTATVLTITPPTGVTAVKWANGFDPTSLDANTRYEILIDNGEWGMACAWI